MHDTSTNAPPAVRTPVPTLDDDGLLRLGNRWVAITDSQLPVVALIVRHHGRLVRNADLRAAYKTAGGSDTTGALRSLVHRLRVRLATVGLELHVIRDRGVLLELGEDAAPIDGGYIDRH